MHASRRGFTLVELLVVIALIAVLLTIAVPSFANLISGFRVSTVTNDFLQGVTLTRTEALKRGRRVDMVPVGGDWRNGWTVFVDTNGNQTLDAGEPLVFRHDPLPPSIAITNSAGAPKPFVDGSNAIYISFDGSGYPRQRNGATLTGGIRLSDSSAGTPNVRTLCLASYGRPRIIAGAVSGPPDPCAAG